jgi:hypothetical protein
VLAKLRPFFVAFTLAFVLALLSVEIERVGPEQGVYSNLCGPKADQLCYKQLLNGGFPVPYLFDAPGISVEDQLAFFEDRFRPGAFAIDVAIYFVLVAFVIQVVWRRRSRV